MSNILQVSFIPNISDELFSIDELPLFLTTQEDKNLAGGIVKKIKDYSKTALLGSGLHEQTNKITAALETFRKLTAKVTLSPNDFGVLCSNAPNDVNDHPLQYFWIPVEDALNNSSRLSGLNDRFHH